MTEACGQLQNVTETEQHALWHAGTHTGATSSEQHGMHCGMQVRTLVQQALNKALEQHDLLLSPVAPTTAFKIGEKTEDPLAMYKEDLMTVHLNLAGKLIHRLHAQCTANDRTG